MHCWEWDTLAESDTVVAWAVQVVVSTDNAGLAGVDGVDIAAWRQLEESMANWEIVVDMDSEGRKLLEREAVEAASQSVPSVELEGRYLQRLGRRGPRIR